MAVKLNRFDFMSILLFILAIVGIICLIHYSPNVKEGFSKAKRIQLLSKASMNGTEKFVGSRSDMLFNGQFDYLKSNAGSSTSTSTATSTSMPIMDTSSTKPTDHTNQHSATAAEASAVASNLASQVASEVSVQTGRTGEVLNVSVGNNVSAPQQFDVTENVEQHNEIVSNAGKALSQEKFGQSRVYNNFNVLMASPEMSRLSSQIAQSEEEKVQTVDTKAMEMKEGFRF
jgi:hypothetical protein